MKLLYIIDNKDYNIAWKKNKREAVRAVILDGDKIAMVKSKVKGYYKFPGGGIESFEEHKDTLIRETQEETGLIISNIIGELGKVCEIHKDTDAPDSIFEQNSYYYYADVYNELSYQHLDKYEADLGYHLEWINIEDAYINDIGLSKEPDMSFLKREAFVLKYILDNR